jgi:hypothetical protein
VVLSAGKAQREFRKRREARVRDLEERCRRFDQMGLEANAELQRVARRLKDENEALRALLNRLGFGNMISSALESVRADHARAANESMGFGGQNDQVADLNMNMSSVPIMSAPAAAKRNSSASTKASKTGTTKSEQSKSNGSDDESSEEDEMDDSLASTSHSTVGRQLGPGDLMAANMQDIKMYQPPTNVASKQRQTYDWQGAPVFAQPQQDDRRTDRAASTSSGDSSAQRADNGKSPSLLSLRALPAPGARQSAQTQPGGTMPTLSHGSGNASGAGMGGSAMLNFNANRPFSGASMAGGASGSSGPSFYPYPQRTHQNDALLNPNPIPFAFSLSSEPPSDQSWWEAMGGGMLTPGQDPNSLDEKAQAVAAAQAGINGSAQGPNGPQSPFDLSAFLTGGLTPTGNYSSQNFESSGMPNSQDTPLSSTMMAPSRSASEKKLGKGNNMAPPMPPTEHAQMFLRLLERKVAARDPSPYASLGFQPPSLYGNDTPLQFLPPGQSASPGNWRIGQNDESAARAGWQAATAGMQQQKSPSSLTPSGVYSRLAQHPAFLTTNERELEELVDAIDSHASSRSPGASSSASSSPSGSNVPARQAGQQSQHQQERTYYGQQQQQQQGRSPLNLARAISARRQSVSGRSSPATGAGGAASVELDESAVDHLMHMLDSKTPGMAHRGAQALQAS